MRSKADSNGCIQSQSNYSYDDFVQKISIEDSRSPKLGFNYVKMHGSTNWIYGENDVVMVTGKNKQMPEILRYGLAMFSDVLGIHGVRLLIIGYSFSDAHINEILFKAAENKVKLWIINPWEFDEFKKSEIYFQMSNGKSRKDQDKKIVLMNSVEKYFPISLRYLLSKEGGYLNMLRQEFENYSS